jgi:hypothetical protein
MDSTLLTTTMVAGINCTTAAHLSAQTTHRAGGSAAGFGVTTFSLGDDSCNANEECESSDEPPTAVAPGPYDPGYDDGSSGAAGGCDDSGGAAPPGSYCHDEYVYIEISNDGGITWTTIWEGWAIVCT